MSIETAIETRLADYLTREAERVHVDDALDDIEAEVDGGMVRMALATAPAPTRRFATIASLAAVTLAIVGATLVLDARRSTPIDAQSAPVGAPVGESSGEQVDESSGEPLTEQIGQEIGEVLPPVEDEPPSYPLPAGGTVQGFTPSCTSTDGIAFRCLIPEYPFVPGFDRTGEVQVIVDDTNHLSGGCRAASADGTEWDCFVGQRSIDEGVVHPPTLGAPWEPGWAEG